MDKALNCDRSNILTAQSVLSQQLSLSSILLLYSISVIYLDVLKLPREQGSRKHGPTIVSAYDILDRYEHPAAKVAQVRDCVFFSLLGMEIRSSMN